MILIPFVVQMLPAFCIGQAVIKIQLDYDMCCLFSEQQRSISTWKRNKISSDANTIRIRG